MTSTYPSPIPNWAVQPANGLGLLGIFAYSSARSLSDWRNLAVSAWNFAMISTLMPVPLPGARAGRRGSSTGIRYRTGGRITGYPGRPRGCWPLSAAGQVVRELG